MFFLNIHENRRDYEYKKSFSNLTCKKLYNKVREIEDNDSRYKIVIICDLKTKCIVRLYKNKMDGTAINKLKYYNFYYYNYMIIQNMYNLEFRNIFISFLIQFHFILISC